jgi:UDP-glucose 4-epimerase
MKILVTGGLGYIGVNTCYQLLKEDHELIIVDNLSNSSIDNLNLLKGRIHFYPIDIRDSIELKKVFEIHKIDLVIHFASLKSVPESIKNPIIYYDNNISGTIQLLNVMKEYKCKRIIFSGSACVYTTTSTSESDKIDVDNIPHAYGKTKYIIEQILENVCTLEKIECIVLRYFNPIGTLIPTVSLSKNISNIMDVILDSILNKKKFRLFGNDYDTRDGSCIRDFIHIYDLVTGHICAMNHFGQCNPFEIINLGCGNGISIFELIETFQRVNQIKLDYDIDSRRKGDLPISLANIEKANKCLNWYPIKTLEEMCIDSYSIIKENVIKNQQEL